MSNQHQNVIGRSQVCLTPRWILDPLGPFACDPCASDPRPWDCAAVNFTEADDGLSRPWPGRVWLNSPFHRYIIGLWLRRMALHNHGIALMHVRTDAAWYHDFVRSAASALFFLDRRVIFLDSAGQPLKIVNPAAKHFGKVANSGAPVMLAAYGPDDAALLASLPARSDASDVLAGQFVLLLFARSVLGAALQSASWRDVVSDFLRTNDGPVSVGDLYEAFANHPKSKRNLHWREKLRQTLQRGAGRRVARDQWVAA